ncbi:hypothetical protein ACO0LF_15290 [Undibacterium sp. Di27W]|uniref:hypothetical protein n=1 Tax=Undibacterium sp. Di27W TaxID=3413036 RepID=UPI003BF151F2
MFKGKVIHVSADATAINRQSGNQNSDTNSNIDGINDGNSASISIFKAKVQGNQKTLVDA